MTHVNVASNAALPDGFVDLPPLIYADDPMWVPEEPASVRAAFNAQNPWFRTGESAAFCVPGKARLATFHEPGMNSHGTTAAYFGYWETIGDSNADDAVFAAAESWAKARGVALLCGPVNFTTFGNFRIRTKAEPNAVNFANEPSNPVYYPTVLAQRGYASVVEAVTQITPAPVAHQVVEARNLALQNIRDRGINIQPFAAQIWLSRAEELHAMIESTFSQNWGYTPLTLEVFKRTCGESYIRKTDPNTSVVMIDPDDRVVGFFLVYPHWGPIINQAAHNRVPLSEIDYNTHWQQLVETGVVMGVPKTSAVLPELQGEGLFTALALAVGEFGHGVYSHWFGALIGADKVNRKLGKRVGDEARWYAAFQKELH